MSELNVQIGQLLKDLRDERGWSLREFGLIVGMNKTYLGDIELGKRNPTINNERTRDVAGATFGSVL